MTLWFSWFDGFLGCFGLRGKEAGLLPVPRGQRSDRKKNREIQLKWSGRRNDIFMNFLDN